MFLYMMYFSKHPDNLVKIGLSYYPPNRLSYLEKVHGDGKIIKSWLFGDKIYVAERFIHKLLTKHSHKIDGDGGTEFFKIEDIPSIILIIDGINRSMENIIDINNAKKHHFEPKRKSVKLDQPVGREKFRELGKKYNRKNIEAALLKRNVSILETEISVLEYKIQILENQLKYKTNQNTVTNQPETPKSNAILGYIFTTISKKFL